MQPYQDVQLQNLMNMAQRAAAKAGAPQELFDQQQAPSRPMGQGGMNL